jgi:hypothetical protein
MEGLQVEIISEYSGWCLKQQLNLWLTQKGNTIDMINISFTHTKIGANMETFTAYIQYIQL